MAEIFFALHSPIVNVEPIWMLVSVSCTCYIFFFLFVTAHPEYLSSPHAIMYNIKMYWGSGWLHLLVSKDDHFWATLCRITSYESSHDDIEKFDDLTLFPGLLTSSFCLLATYKNNWNLESRWETGTRLVIALKSHNRKEGPWIVTPIWHQTVLFDN